VPAERIAAARGAAPLADIINTPATKYERQERRPLVRSSVQRAETG
jgi:hypothetical protein